ncbi:MAG TPA: plasmid stabilization protein [Mesorhizobium sp.]|jgi:hypothetical protein
MASVTIRNVDERTKRNLRLRAARRGVSMEEEARTILRIVAASDIRLDEGDGESAWDVIQRLREKYGTYELEVLERSAMVGDSLQARD